MGSPQIEDGYTKVANELLEAIIATDLASRKLRCFLAVMRKTYGWQKKSAAISYSEISKMTNIKGQQHVIKAINELVEDEILKRTKSQTGNIYEINKKYRTWKPFPQDVSLFQKQDIPKTGHPENRISRKGVSGYPENGTGGYPENGTGSCMDSHDLMPCSESLKKYKEKKEREAPLFEHQKSPIPSTGKTSISSSSKKNNLAEALGKLQASDAEVIIWQALCEMNPPCTLDDVKTARVLKKKNNLAFLKDCVCECRDARIDREENEMPRGGITLDGV